MSRLLKSLLIAAPLCVAGAAYAQSATDTQPMYSPPPGSAAPPAYEPAPTYSNTPAPAPEPSAKQKIKNGAHTVKSDAKAAKADIKSGSKEAWHEVKSGTKHAWNSTKEGAHEAKTKIKRAFKGDDSAAAPAPVAESSYNSAGVDAPR